MSIARLTPLLLLAGSLACTGWMTPSGPFSGDGGLELVLQGSNATADVDAPVLAERFEEVGVTATATVDAPDRVTLKLQGIDTTADRTQLLARAVVELAFPNGEVLSNDAIADANAIVGEFDNLPAVQIVMTDAGAERFCTLSGQSVGEVVAIRLDGEIQSEPIVREAICGGQILITMGVSQSFEQSLEEASGLASALRTEPLTSDWTVLSEAVFY